MDSSITSRRSFLHLLGAGLVTPFVPQTGARPAGTAPAAKAVQAFARFGGVLGLQLYSLRHQMEKDVPGTLAMVRDWGLSEVETAGYYGRTAAAFAEELKRTNLTAKSMHAGYDLLRDNLKQAVADAKALGATYVTTAWISHKPPFAREHAEGAAAHFSAWGRALKNEGLGFMYHLHGYEFAPGPHGTLLDTILQATPADAVHYEMDVFWVVRGGGDPVALLQRHKGRFPALHLKDMKKGTATGDLTGGAPDDTNVPLGTGMINYPSVLKAARDAGTKLFYIEDEHQNVVQQVPRTLQYLGGLTL
jgi:sugar phosphate isomerase/epimerase